MNAIKDQAMNPALMIAIGKGPQGRDGAEPAKIGPEGEYGKMPCCEGCPYLAQGQQQETPPNDHQLTPEPSRFQAA
jgi:hypothetical protein